MKRILITGSSDGLGLLAGRQLAAQGHEVVLHARTEARADAARAALPAAKAVVVGDVSVLAEIRAVAEQANALGRFDAVIHNVGVGDRERRIETVDGLSRLFAINTVAPYLLTALVARPARLIYLSSGMHTAGDASLDDLQWTARRWNSSQAYSDSKLHDLLLALAIARRWPDVPSNAVDPGWVPTRMGGAGAPDDLTEGAVTQVWLAASDDAAATATGRYLHHQQPGHAHRDARRVDLQDRLLDVLRELTGVAIAS